MMRAYSSSRLYAMAFCSLLALSACTPSVTPFPVSAPQSKSQTPLLVLDAKGQPGLSLDFKISVPSLLSTQAFAARKTIADIRKLDVALVKDHSSDGASEGRYDYNQHLDPPPVTIPETQVKALFKDIPFDLSGASGESKEFSVRIDNISKNLIKTAPGLGFPDEDDRLRLLVRAQDQNGFIISKNHPMNDNSSDQSKSWATADFSFRFTGDNVYRFARYDNGKNWGGVNSAGLAATWVGPSYDSEYSDIEEMNNDPGQPDRIPLSLSMPLLDEVDGGSELRSETTLQNGLFRNTVFNYNRIGVGTYPLASPVLITIPGLTQAPAGNIIAGTPVKFFNSGGVGDDRWILFSSSNPIGLLEDLNLTLNYIHVAPGSNVELIFPYGAASFNYSSCDTNDCSGTTETGVLNVVAP